MIRFTAKIQIVGVNPYVTVPARVSRYFGKRGNVPVVVHLQDGRVTSTLVPIGGGVHRLYINAAMFRCTESRVGDIASVVLAQDTSNRVLKAPDCLVAKLRASPIAAARWESFAPSKRHEIIRYILSCKTAPTRDRNVAKLLRVLKSQANTGRLCGIHIPEQRQTRANKANLFR